MILNNVCSQQNSKKGSIMKKVYKIEVDCADCANKMELATKKTEGIKDATEIGRAHV